MISHYLTFSALHQLFLGVPHELFAPGRFVVDGVTRFAPFLFFLLMDIWLRIRASRSIGFATDALFVMAEAVVPLFFLFT